MNVLLRDNNISIGDSIKYKLREKNISIVRFANMLNCSRAYVYKLLSKNSMETSLLEKISIVLDHDFFADFSNCLGEK